MYIDKILVIRNKKEQQKHCFAAYNNNKQPRVSTNAGASRLRVTQFHKITHFMEDLDKKWNSGLVKMIKRKKKIGLKNYPNTVLDSRDIQVFTALYKKK